MLPVYTNPVYNAQTNKFLSTARTMENTKPSDQSGSNHTHNSIGHVARVLAAHATNKLEACVCQS